MSKSTRATLFLEQLGVAFARHTYLYEPNAERIGLYAAKALGAPAGRVLKTLMAEVDGKPTCVIIPSDREVSMKKLAAAVGGKAAQMMRPADAERMTGYHVGGISPFGQKRQTPAVMEVDALSLPTIFINGGQRGLQLQMKPQDALRALAAKSASLS